MEAAILHCHISAVALRNYSNMGISVLGVSKATFEDRCVKQNFE